MTVKKPELDLDSWEFIVRPELDLDSTTALALGDFAARLRAKRERPRCEVCGIRPLDMGRHVGEAAHRLRVRVAELEADGWVRASPFSMIIKRSDAPWITEPSSVKPPHGRDFAQAVWTKLWARQIVGLANWHSYGPRPRESVDERLHWISLRAKDPAWADFDETFEPLMRLGGVEAVTGRLRKIAPLRVARVKVKMEGP